MLSRSLMVSGWNTGRRRFRIGATNRFALHHEEVLEERLPLLGRELEGDRVREIDRPGMQVGAPSLATLHARTSSAKRKGPRSSDAV